MNLAFRDFDDAHPFDQQCQARAIAVRHASEIDFDSVLIREPFGTLLQQITGGRGVEYAAHAESPATERFQFSATESGISQDDAVGFATVPLAT